MFADIDRFLHTFQHFFWLDFKVPDSCWVPDTESDIGFLITCYGDSRQGRGHGTGTVIYSCYLWKIKDGNPIQFWSQYMEQIHQQQFFMSQTVGWHLEIILKYSAWKISKLFSISGSILMAKTQPLAPCKNQK